MQIRPSQRSQINVAAPRLDGRRFRGVDSGGIANADSGEARAKKISAELFEADRKEVLRVAGFDVSAFDTRHRPLTKRPQSRATEDVESAVVETEPVVLCEGNKASLSLRFRSIAFGDFDLSGKVTKTTVTVFDDTVPIWVVRALHKMGMRNLARAILSKDVGTVDFGVDPMLLEDQTLLVVHPLSNRATTDTPATFQADVNRFVQQLEKLKTGRLILDQMRRRNVSVIVTFKAGKAEYGGKLAGRQLMLLDPAHANRSTYVALAPVTPKGPLVPVESPQPGAVVLGHELIHAIHDAADSAAYLRRNATTSEAPWDNHEEELTIKGRILNSGDSEPISECHLLADLDLPLRWGHDRSLNPVSSDLIRRHYPADLLARALPAELPMLKHHGT